MHQVKELKIWNKAVELTVDVYKATATLPKEEKSGLISQMRNCAVSIPSNIAEGAGRNTKGEFNQFPGYANSSSYESMTQLILAGKLNLLTEEQCDQLDLLQKMTYNLQTTLK